MRIKFPLFMINVHGAYTNILKGPLRQKSSLSTVCLPKMHVHHIIPR